MKGESVDRLGGGSFVGITILSNKKEVINRGRVHTKRKKSGGKTT